MTRTKIFIVLLLASPLIFHAVSQSVAGQALSDISSQESQEHDPALSRVAIENVQVLMDLESIQVSFLVRDFQGNFIRNLSANDFVIVENGRQLPIMALREQEVPISAVVMVDTSYSLSHFLDNAVKTAVDFFKGLDKERSAFVLFSESPRVVLDWKDQTVDVSAALHNVEPDGKTALHDSVIWVAQNMFDQQSGKKAIILLTDGIDTVSQSSFKTMMATARDAGVALYPIIYTNEYIQNYREGLEGRRKRPNSNISRDFHRFIVAQNEFVDESLRYGGRVIFSRAFTDLNKIYTNIIHEMKSQYVMLYESSSTDGDIDNRDVKVYTDNIPGKIFIDITR
ncbi:MAG: VWA domain-containing protein [Acidobacteriota bacterium]